MIGLDQFKVTRIEEKSDYGVFEIGPLPRGYGYTISNSLRRMLSSSIKGAAITGIKITGVKHEYTTLNGLQEDVISLVLKLKDLAIKLDGEDKAVIKLNVKGKKNGITTITASDFELPSSVEIINKDMEIATLTSDVNLEIEAYVESGMGYAYPDEAKREEVGVIPLDAIFSPVRRVKVEVGQSRVGQFTDLDQVRLEIYTNGAKTPTEALLSAVETYDQIANRLVDLLGGDSSKLDAQMNVEQEAAQVEEVRVPISELGLTTRLNNALLNTGITNLADISKYSKDEVAGFRGMGKKSLTELIVIMEKHNIKFE
jgi:DNA-directed RNA polymerase subunit alpha